MSRPPPGFVIDEKSGPPEGFVIDKPVGMGETAVRKFGQGASFGFTDEISGLTSATIDKIGFGDLYKNQTFVERYKANRDQRRAELTKMETDNPITSNVAEIGGGVASGIALAGGAVAKVATTPLLGTVAKEGAKLGAKYGATGGLGYSEADTPLGIVADTALGTGIGATAGAALPVASGLTGKLISATANKSEGFTDALSTLVKNGVTALTKGQARGSDTLKMAETTIAQAPLVGGAVAKKLAEGRRQYQGALLKMVGLDDGTTLINSKTIDRLRVMFNDQYAKALNGKGVGLHEDEFLDKLAQFETHYVDDIPDVNKANIVRTQIARLLNDAAKSAEDGQITGKAYQMMRSKLGRMANKTSDPDISHPLKDLKTMLDESFAKASGGDIASVNSRYSLFKDLEDVVDVGKAASQAEGFIVPSRLAAVAAKKSGNQEWKDLTNAAAVVLPDRIPNSATAQRRLFLEMVGLTAGVGGGAMLSDPVQIAKYGALGAGAAYSLSRGKIPGPVRAPLGSFAVPAITGPVLSK